MEKNIKHFFKKFMKNGFIKRFKNVTINFNFVMIYIHKMLALLKINLNYIKDSIFECFFKEYNGLLFFFLKKTIFFTTYIDGNLSLEEEIITEDIRNLFRLKKQLNSTATKDVRNLFRLEKETKTIKDRILRDIKNLFEHEEEQNYYEPVRVSHFCSSNYIEYKSNVDSNTIS